jgi:hypothetical protein
VKFKTDENLPLEAALTLREAGFAGETVWDEALSGAPDKTIAARIQEEGRIFVTLDLDFSNIQVYPPDQLVYRYRRAAAKDPGQSGCGRLCSQTDHSPPRANSSG